MLGTMNDREWSWNSIFDQVDPPRLSRTSCEVPELAECSIGLTEAGRLLASSLLKGTPSRCVFYTPSRDFSRLA
jgi:hypothetical protein